MGITEEIERKRIRLREIRRDMASINPKLSLYAKLDAEAKQVEIELANLGAKRLPPKQNVLPTQKN